MIKIFRILVCYSKKMQKLLKNLSLSSCQDIGKTTYNLKIERKSNKDAKKNRRDKCHIEGLPSVDKNTNIQKYKGLEKYTLIEKLGDGAHSNVYKALCNDSKEYVAIKVIRKSKLNHLQKANVFKEIQIMQDVDHPNIVRFLDFLENDDYYFLILELLEGGEIFHQIVRLTYFSEDLSRHIILQVAHAIRYLHEEKGIVHRDIKPENILFRPIPFVPSKFPKVRTGEDINKQDEGEFIQGIGSGGIGHVKIADFGLSKVIWDKQTMTPCGTISYTAPEIIKDQKYSKCVDMWALGCVLYTLLCGFPPFYDQDIQILSKKVAYGEYSFLSPWWDEISESSQDLISNLLTVDPKKRYTIDQFLNHPWILGSSKKTLSTYDMSCFPNTLAINSTSSKSKSKKLPIFRKFQKNFRSPNTIHLREIFDISYILQYKENVFHVSAVLNDSFGNTEEIDYFIKAFQENILSRTPNKSIFFPNKTLRDIFRNQNKEKYNTSTSPSSFSFNHSFVDHSVKPYEPQFELFLEKSTLLCRRKALISVDKNTNIQKYKGLENFCVYIFRIVQVTNEIMILPKDMCLLYIKSVYRLIFILIDALRSDFVFSNSSSMTFTQRFQYALLFISSLFSQKRPLNNSNFHNKKYQYYFSAQQPDVIPTLAFLLGFNIPKNSIGIILPELLDLWQDTTDQLKILKTNYNQISKLVETIYDILPDVSIDQLCSYDDDNMKKMACIKKHIENLEKKGTKLNHLKEQYINV
ncbi:hypothetical protein PORY_002668 [Pneumocystis oryctolagi]|uniref:Uncharacterized protein n=1 Tax=Pneumocystis oryctolagi TaxID=42067 RepID=A0ACB7C8D3_9ASCO|nr:hypothetical protein PORY_002668 [Pneumocystis oryctolagi]